MSRRKKEKERGGELLSKEIEMRSIPARTALPGVELYGLQRVVFVDSENRIPGTRADLAEPVAGTLRGEFVR